MRGKYFWQRSKNLGPLLSPDPREGNERSGPIMDSQARTGMSYSQILRVHDPDPPGKHDRAPGWALGLPRGSILGTMVDDEEFGEESESICHILHGRAPSSSTPDGRITGARSCPAGRFRARIHGPRFVKPVWWYLRSTRRGEKKKWWPLHR